MSLILAIEPDPRQSEQLADLVRRRVRADLVQAPTTEGALAALATVGDRVPDLVLVPSLLSAQEDAAIAGALRVIATAANVRMLTIPLLADAEQPAQHRGVFARLRGKKRQTTPGGCAPEVFAEQIVAYLAEAAAERKARREEIEELQRDQGAVPAPPPAVAPTSIAQAPETAAEPEFAARHEPASDPEPVPIPAQTYAPLIIQPVVLAPDPLIAPEREAASQEPVVIRGDAWPDRAADAIRDVAMTFDESALRPAAEAMMSAVGESVIVPPPVEDGAEDRTVVVSAQVPEPALEPAPALELVQHPEPQFAQEQQPLEQHGASEQQVTDPRVIEPQVMEPTAVEPLLVMASSDLAEALPGPEASPVMDAVPVLEAAPVLEASPVMEASPVIEVSPATEASAEAEARLVTQSHGESPEPIVTAILQSFAASEVNVPGVITTAEVSAAPMPSEAPPAIAATETPIAAVEVAPEPAGAVAAEAVASEPTLVPSALPAPSAPPAQEEVIKARFWGSRLRIRRAAKKPEPAAPPPETIAAAADSAASAAESVTLAEAAVLSSEHTAPLPEPVDIPLDDLVIVAPPVETRPPEPVAVSLAAVTTPPAPAATLPEALGVSVEALVAPLEASAALVEEPVATVEEPIARVEEPVVPVEEPRARPARSRIRLPKFATRKPAAKPKSKPRDEAEEFDVDALIAPLLSEIAATRKASASARRNSPASSGEPSSVSARQNVSASAVEPSAGAACETTSTSSVEPLSVATPATTPASAIEAPTVAARETTPESAIEPPSVGAREVVPASHVATAPVAAREEIAATTSAPATIVAGPTDDVDPMFFADDALTVPPPTQAQAERSAWIELVESLRQDIERLKAEREEGTASAAQASAPAAAEPPPTVTKPVTAAPSAHRRPAAPAVNMPAAPSLPARLKPRRPVEDQWGLFDPEQCGFAALLAKLDEISARDEVSA